MPTLNPAASLPLAPTASFQFNNRQLLLMGIFLHDISKVRELSYDRAFSYTDEGQLIGHLVLGVEMLGEQVRCVPNLTGDLLMQPGVPVSTRSISLVATTRFSVGSGSADVVTARVAGPVCVPA